MTTKNGSLQQRIQELDPWFQKIQFPDGTKVGRWHTKEMFDRLTIGTDLKDQTFLDVGAMSGASMLLAEKQGAICHGIDIEERTMKQMGLVREVFDASFTFDYGSVYDLQPGMFDHVYMTGVYYHLKHPLLGIERAWNATRKTLFIEGEILWGEAGCYCRFYPEAYKGDGSNWNVPTVECFEAWLSTLEGAGELTTIYPLVSASRVGAIIRRV